MPDIDIDFKDRKQILDKIKHTPATIFKDGELQKHNTGIYVVDIPVEPVSGQASIDYKKAEELGYFKLDFLNVGVYDKIKDEKHLEALMNKEPNWKRLWTDRDFCGKVIHIGSYYDLLGRMKPDSIPRMAMFLSVIRPAKRHLIGKDWKEIAETVWDKPEGDEYYFKKSHSVSYAQLVAVHMNLIESQ